VHRWALAGSARAVLDERVHGNALREMRAHLAARERGAAIAAAGRTRAWWSPRFVLDNVLAPGGAPGAGGGGEKNQSCENVVSHLVRSPRAAREAAATKKTAVPVSNVNG